MLGSEAADSAVNDEPGNPTAGNFNWSIASIFSATWFNKAGYSQINNEHAPLSGSSARFTTTRPEAARGLNASSQQPKHVQAAYIPMPIGKDEDEQDRQEFLATLISTFAKRMGISDDFYRFLCGINDDTPQSGAKTFFAKDENARKAHVNKSRDNFSNFFTLEEGEDKHRLRQLYNLLNPRDIPESSASAALADRDVEISEVAKDINKTKLFIDKLFFFTGLANAGEPHAFLPFDPTNAYVQEKFLREPDIQQMLHTTGPYKTFESARRDQRETDLKWLLGLSVLAVAGFGASYLFYGASSLGILYFFQETFANQAAAAWLAEWFKLFTIITNGFWNASLLLDATKVIFENILIPLKEMVSNPEKRDKEHLQKLAWGLFYGLTAYMGAYGMNASTKPEDYNNIVAYWYAMIVNIMVMFPGAEALKNFFITRKMEEREKEQLITELLKGFTQAPKEAIPAQDNSALEDAATLRLFDYLKNTLTRLSAEELQATLAKLDEHLRERNYQLNTDEDWESVIKLLKDILPQEAYAQTKWYESTAAKYTLLACCITAIAGYILSGFNLTEEQNAAHPAFKAWYYLCAISGGIVLAGTEFRYVSTIFASLNKASLASFIGGGVYKAYGLVLSVLLFCSLSSGAGAGNAMYRTLYQYLQNSSEAGQGFGTVLVWFSILISGFSNGFAVKPFVDDFFERALGAFGNTGSLNSRVLFQQFHDIAGDIIPRMQKELSDKMREVYNIAQSGPLDTLKNCCERKTTAVRDVEQGGYGATSAMLTPVRDSLHRRRAVVKAEFAPNATEHVLKSQKAFATAYDTQRKVKKAL